MTERPILFSAPMVRALLDGSKTQTRRIANTGLFAIDARFHGDETAARELAALAKKCPYGQPGDRLWVRESFWGCDLPGYGDQPCVVYDNEWVGKEYIPAEARPWGRKFGRIPSIHMPRECSRILLEIVSVRVERLNDCSDADAIAEGIGLNSKAIGVPLTGTSETIPHAMYRDLWESINGAGSWAANPWVWVVEFKRVTP